MGIVDIHQVLSSGRILTASIQEDQTLLLSANLSKNTLPSLRVAIQIYHWLAHNTVSFQFAYSLLLFFPSMNVSLFEKLNVLYSSVTNNSPMNRFSMLNSFLCPKSYVLYIPLLSQIWPGFIQKSSLFHQQSLRIVCKLLNLDLLKHRSHSFFS